jgi:hypothetical protein
MEVLSHFFGRSRKKRVLFVKHFFRRDQLTQLDQASVGTLANPKVEKIFFTELVGGQKPVCYRHPAKVKDGHQWATRNNSFRRKRGAWK